MKKVNIKWQVIVISMLIPLSVVCQISGKKEAVAIRTTEPPKIDAILDEPQWDETIPASNFVQFKPNNGAPASFDSDVRFLYDDQAMYIGAILNDPHPDSINTELSERDNQGIVDNFGVYIDCYNDYLTAYGFMVTAAGVQIDLKSTESYGEDESWDAVWDSQVAITSEGWVVEMKIPYSALRFPKTEKQVWGLQIFRRIMRYKETTTWNLIDRGKDGINNQAGILQGPENINPPLRLSFVPYVSGYVEKNPDAKNWANSYNLGLDLKYGFSESFTLDMTLVPDFGQVQSDDEIYNLSPFEVYYDEKRPFFMEGTELFNKGNVFYSRRIGKTPSGFGSVSDSMTEGEKIDKNPQNAQLINATKISGKTKNKLAIGVFNAMTADTRATLVDSSSGNSRNIITEPFTNYNMFVIDQAILKKSFVSFYNTNTWQPESGYSANVTGAETKLTDNSNTWAIWGQGIVSQKYNTGMSPEFGYTYGLEAGKTSGNFTFSLTHQLIDDNYDPNDMGFLSHNNFISDGLSVSYNIYKPVWRILDWFSTVWMEYNQLYNPSEYTSFELGLNSHGTFKNHLTTWFNFELTPVDAYDYYEPRIAERYYVQPPSWSFGGGLSPDYRKRFVVDINYGVWQSARYDQYGFWLGIGPRFRISDKWFAEYEFRIDPGFNDIGYVADSLNGDVPVIIFGKRDNKTWVNTLSVNYWFNNKTALNFRMRHYWLTLQYHEFYELNADGSLANTNYNEPQNLGFNIFNIDMSYVWNFAPGSELRLVWKNAITNEEQNEMIESTMHDIEYRFGRNFRNTIQSPAVNSFSIKMLYYIDYQSLQRKNRKIR
ncbi:MAG: carbohydrate binding family 9 domain-containing protein [Bacteroidales bacterium]|nr:carbohydrate binding family 9 domain-containing protein [Bacteroidales bacterium]